MQAHVPGQGRNNSITDDQRSSGSNSNMNSSEPQNTSAGGGTTDMDDADRSGAVTQGMGHGSSVSTKRNVTSSDFDGQVSTE